ncbi:MAG: biotin--[acetyl-CoA-carboxylase] ligase [Planctomycetota bacterium]|nr:biotin--[acetyl-CoA-carboxylase] ligase [Planctomycetota bacterium]
MQSASRIMELLYDRGDVFFSLAELARDAGVRRVQLDAAIEQLQAGGHRLEFSPAHGVRLSRPVALDAHLIERQLGTRRIGRHAIVFAEVDSTNDVAFDSSAQTGADGLVVLAEYQRRGRGRAGRRWLSPPGLNIMMSVLLTDRPDAPCHDTLTIAAGLAVAEGVEAACAADGRTIACRLKWPNDVMLDAGKLAGVLVQTRRRQKRRCVVIGIGINVNAAPPPEDVDRPAIALAEHVGRPVERIEVVRCVLRRMDKWVARITAGKLDKLHSQWMSRCGMMNERITALCRRRRYTGRVSDVDPLKGLILFDDHGRSVHLPAEYTTILE